MKKRYVIGGVLVGLVVLGMLASGEDGGKGAAPAAKPGEPPLTVSAVEVSKAFQDNEAKAKLDYEGKTLVVTGVVKDIDLDISDSPVIKLKGSGDAYGMGVNNDGKMTDVDIAGLSKEEAAAISKGAKMTFTCTRIDEVLGSAQLGDCKIS